MPRSSANVSAPALDERVRFRSSCPLWGQKRRFELRPATSGLPRGTDIVRPPRQVRLVPTTDIIGALDTVNSLYEEPFFSCRQGRGSPPPAATGSPFPIRAVSEQHLHADTSLVRRNDTRY